MTTQAGICRHVALVALSAALLGTIACQSEGPAAQEAAVEPASAPQPRRVIRPDKSPDIGLPYIREVLQAAAMDFSDVVNVTVYITDFKEFDRFNTLYREYFPSAQPARATVQVAALNGGARIELQMIAVKR